MTSDLKPKAYSSKRALTLTLGISTGRGGEWGGGGVRRRELEGPLLCVDHGSAEQELLLLLLLLASFLL